MVLVVVVGVVEGTVTREGVLFNSIGGDMIVGLQRAADNKSAVVVDVLAVVILEEVTSAGGEGVVITLQAGDAVTGALDSPAEFRMGL